MSWSRISKRCESWQRHSPSWWLATSRPVARGKLKCRMILKESLVVENELMVGDGISKSSSRFTMSNNFVGGGVCAAWRFGHVIHRHSLLYTGNLKQRVQDRFAYVPVFECLPESNVCLSRIVVVCPPVCSFHRRGNYMCFSTCFNIQKKIMIDLHAGMSQRCKKSCFHPSSRL